MDASRNQVVFLTGASSGIGEALAREYAKRGAHLFLMARRADLLMTLTRELAELGGRAVAYACDVTHDEDLEKAAEAARREFGKIDIVIANAGFGVSGLVEDLSLEDYRRQFETNVYGVLRTYKAAAEDLHKSAGRFAIVGSVSGHVATPATSAYAMSKFAVRAFADSLRAEIRRTGVSVTLISPGFVRSQIRRVDNLGKVHQQAKDSIPMWIQMPADKAARKIIRAIARRRRERILTFHGWLGVQLQRFFPGFLAWVLSKSKVKSRDGSMRPPMKPQ